MTWPTLDREDAQTWCREMIRTADAVDVLADRITVYPGGGAPAHELHQAARLLNSAHRRILEGMVPA